jgi:filamentous hemagglutinin
LNSLTARTDVNWQPVKLAHESWNYQHEGLTPAGAALLSVAVAVATGGAGAGLVGATSSLGVAAANAAFSSLAAQASISLINNKGDVSKTLKELGSSQTVKNMIIAAGVAGFTSYTDSWGNTLTTNGNKIVTDWAKRSQAILLNTAAKGALTGANSNGNWWTIAALGMAGEAYQYWVGRVADVDRDEPVFDPINDEGGSGLYRVPRVDVTEVLKREGKNIGLNENPCISIMQICHGTPISNALNTLPGFNAFATLHDTWMNKPDFMNLATNLGTMPPALLLTFGSLIDQYRYINTRRK